MEISIFSLRRISEWMVFPCIAMMWMVGYVQPVNAQTEKKTSSTGSQMEMVAAPQSSPKSPPGEGKPGTTAGRKTSPPHGDALPDREMLVQSLEDFNPDFYRKPFPLIQLGEELGKQVIKAGSPQERYAAFLAIPKGLRAFVNFNLPVSVKHELYRIQAADFARRHPERASEVTIAISIHPEYSSLSSRRDPVTGWQKASDTVAVFDLLYAQNPRVQDTFMAIVSELVPFSCAWNCMSSTYLTTEGVAYLESIIDVAPSAGILIERMKSRGRILSRPDPSTEKRLPSGAMPHFDGVFYCRPGEITFIPEPNADQ